jgi:hypothetical protein
MQIREIPNSRLTPRQIPKPGADWRKIEKFALSYNGYESYGEDCGKFANEARHEYESTSKLRDRLTLSELRTCLFFEQRRYRWFAENPTAKDIPYINNLLEAIAFSIQRT